MLKVLDKFDLMKFLAYSALTFFTIQFAAGMPFTNAIVATIYIVATFTAGAIVWLQISYSRIPSLIELLGMGLVVSTISIALLNLLYRTVFSGAPVATLIFIFLVAIFQIRYFSRRNMTCFIRSDSYQLEISFMGVMASGYLSALSTYFFPLFITFVFISIFSKLSRRNNGNVSLFVSVATLLTGLLITKHLQRITNQIHPSWRWISNDAIYDTSQSVGVGRYGLIDNVFSVGQQNRGYLLVYSWSGDFANLTSIPHLEIATISFAVVALIGICCCSFAICKLLEIPKFVTYMICGSILFQSSFPEANLGGEYLKINNMITLLWLIGFLTLLIESKLRLNKLLVYVTYLVPTIIMFGKFHFGVLALIIVLLATNPVSYDRNSPFRIESFNWSHVFGSISAIALFILSYKMFIEFPNRQSSRLTFDIQFLRWSIILFFFRFIGFRIGNFQDVFNFRRIINALMIFSLMFYVFSSGANNSIYFISGSLAVASFGIFTVLINDQNRELDKHLFIQISVTAFSIIASFIAYADYTSSYWNYLANPTFTLKYALYTNYSFLVQPVLLVLMFLLIVFSLVCFAQIGFNSISKQVKRLMVLAIFGSNLGFFLFLPFRPLVLNEKYNANEYQIFPVNSEIVDGLSFVRSATPTDAIVASNRLCNAPIGPESQTPGWPAGSLVTCGNVNFLSPVSALSERRQLLEAPVFNNTIGPYMDEDTVSRYELVIRFFNNPSVEDLITLKSYSVSVLFVDKSLFWNESIESFGSVVFENSSSVVILI